MEYPIDIPQSTIPIRVSERISYPDLVAECARISDIRHETYVNNGRVKMVVYDQNGVECFSVSYQSNSVPPQRVVLSGERVNQSLVHAVEIAIKRRSRIQLSEGL